LAKDDAAMMRSLIFATSMLALALGAATLSGCASVGQGQASLIGVHMDWRAANKVPAGMVGDIIRARRIPRNGEK
jgi:outer membrane protein assembly factor BamE (lipoprotein component of BamABCDE complex)